MAEQILMVKRSSLQTGKDWTGKQEEWWEILITWRAISPYTNNPILCNDRELALELMERWAEKYRRTSERDGY